MSTDTSPASALRTLAQPSSALGAGSTFMVDSRTAARMRVFRPLVRVLSFPTRTCYVGSPALDVDARSQPAGRLRTFAKQRVRVADGRSLDGNRHIIVRIQF